MHYVHTRLISYYTARTGNALKYSFIIDNKRDGAVTIYANETVITVNIHVRLEKKKERER